MAFEISRRWFVASFGAAVTGKVLLQPLSKQESKTTQQTEGEHDPELTLPPKLVYKFVRAAHLNLSQTEALLQEEPRLIRVAWEWGPGDFEMGIDGAAHSGSRDIVQFLVEKGAPYTIFAAAALGDLDSVKSMVTKFPTIVHSTGPHEIPLIEHAIAGGEPAKQVAEFLSERGAVPREKPKDLPTTADYRQAVVGQYKLTVRGQEVDFRIYDEGEKLFIDAGHMGIKRLQYQGQDIFQMEGTPAQITFEHGENSAIGAFLREGAPIGRAIRVK